jgi:drug/metabolite transporter (DMT)-like permease
MAPRHLIPEPMTTQWRQNLRGIAAMLVAVGALSLMDGSLKTLSQHYGVWQVACLRGLVTLPVAAVWIALTGGFRQVVRVRFSLHLARGLLGITTLAAFAYGVRTLKLSEAYTIFFVAPLLITAFAALMLRERVDRRRWIVILAGFAGVMIVLRPTGEGAVSLAGLAILASAVGYALSAITVRVLGRTDSSQSMVFWLMLFVSLGAGALALPGWRPIQSADWPVIGAMAVTGSIGQWAITEAFKRGEASVIAPLEYTALAWGVALDWILWRALPVPRTFIGAAIVIACGIHLVRRERSHEMAEHP